MDCLSGCLMSSASIQKLFCEICSVFKCSFDEFVGEKVVSPSYSSTVLELPLRIIFYKNLIVKSSNNNFIKTQTVESANYSKKMIGTINLELILKKYLQRCNRFDPLEKGKATHSTIFAWRIPWTEEPDGLQSMGSQTVQ